jgi:3',5'-nucleoside bisphosphate phosphatase
MEKIDLHIHTCYSDGSFEPKEVVKLAKQRNLKAISITDHDIISGIKEAKKYGKDYGIEVISGIEFTSKVNCSSESIHLLGYLFDEHNPKIIDFSNKVENIKRESTENKLKLLNQYMKINVKYEDVAKKTKGIPASPHIAEYLLERNLVSDMKEGVNLFVKGGPCYAASSNKIFAKEAIDIIHSAGGVAVLAHLFAYKNENKFVSKVEQENLVKELKSYGIDGVEIYISKISVDDLLYGDELCKKYSLMKTGGSDFHDEKRLPDNILGKLNLDYRILDELKELSKKHRQN